jgi:hypothetical protein
MGGDGGWTFKTLKEYFDRRFTDSFKALKEAAKSVSLRLKEMNKLRRQIETERGNYVTREMHDILEKQVNRLENVMSNYQGRIIGYVSAIGAVVVAISLVLKFMGK